MRGLERAVWVGAVTAGLVVLSALPAVGQSSGAKPKATEIGVSATEIHIAVAADVDNSLAPVCSKGRWTA